MDATERQRRVWQGAADSYDRKIAGTERWLFAGGREWIGERARGRVLEVAIGTGRSLPFYADDVVLTGVDLTDEMAPFADASFDTVVCELGLCSIPHPDAAVAEMRRVLRAGGELLLFDHVGSSWPPVWALQWLVERVTIPMAGEHFTRRQLPVVRAAGFEVLESRRTRAGAVELVRARRM